MNISIEEANKMSDIFFDDWRAMDVDWKGLIKSKDLGLEYTNIAENRYKVTDQKKWMLAKIKLGI